MPTPKKLKFRISSALKDIIGQDLITDDFMAIFELVKNSYDAHATQVDIVFESTGKKKSSIVISDNGKGMTIDDLKNKWLFVAYSAKKEGTEDSDYRQKLFKTRAYAGAKGIGRFSCDRLGKKLKIETKTKGGKTEILNIDWQRFEKNMRDEFKNISIDYSWRNRIGDKSGTILTITELRSDWDRNKILKLNDSLAKLITPTPTRDNKQFKINIVDEAEIENDEKSKKKKVNGFVKNFIFEELGLKTTKIETSISSNGKVITTTLIDGGTIIYKIKERNPFKLLHDINIAVYYLNKSAKLTFAKRMGLASRLYGHIFLYKNGIRIYPFGEPTEDPLKIDERKSRKQFSRLGTSELIGQIEILGNNIQLKETTSRGDGLINNSSYDELKKYFNVFVLERLEKYVVDVQEWGLSIEENLDEYDDQKLKIKISELIKDLTNSEGIIHFSYSPNFIEIIQNLQSKSAVAVLDNLKRIANKSKNSDLIAETKEIEKKLNQLRQAKEEIEREAKTTQNELVEKDSQNLFLKSIKSQDLEDVLNLMHHIGISTSTVQNYIRGIIFRIDSNIQFTSKELKDSLQKISLEINRIYSISRFATRANFKLSVKPTKIDILDFINEYLMNVVKPFLPSAITLSVRVDSLKPFYKEVRPLEITILLDNLISNSRKAKASKITVNLKATGKNTLTMIFKDNGIGIKPGNAEKIYDYGFTTTDGSGIGLNHIVDILKRLNSSIVLNIANKKETEFDITFNQF